MRSLLLQQSNEDDEGTNEHTVVAEIDTNPNRLHVSQNKQTKQHVTGTQ